MCTLLNFLRPILRQGRKEHPAPPKARAHQAPQPVSSLTTIVTRSSCCQLLDITFKPLLHFNNYKAVWPLTNKTEAFSQPGGRWSVSHITLIRVSALPNRCLPIVIEMGSLRLGTHAPPCQSVRLYVVGCELRESLRLCVLVNGETPVEDTDLCVCVLTCPRKADNGSSTPKITACGMFCWARAPMAL